MSEKVGFIGLGSMGRPIAEHLLKAGYGLRVYNRDKRKAEPLVAQGAELIEKPGDVPFPGGIVMTMLSDDAAVKSIVESEGFLDHLGRGGVHISMSTISPDTTSELTGIHKVNGTALVSSPVLINPTAAAGKQL